MLRVLALVALAASLWVGGPVDAHVGDIERLVFEAQQLPLPPEPTVRHHVLVAGEAPDTPWPIAVVVLLAAVALAQRRSRRVVGAALVVLVAIFGVEAAVHSVHHGLGGDPVACPTASIAAHLHGTTVVALALDAPIQQVGSLSAQPRPSLASLRSLDPSQPRAPPSPLI